MRRILALLTLIVLLLSACGSDSSESSSSGGNDSGVVVADETDNDDGGEELTLEDIDGVSAEPDPEGGDNGEEVVEDDGSEELTIEEFEGEEAGEEGEEDRIAVAEADEDPIDSMLNSLTVFNSCISDEGFDVEKEGLPGAGGEDIADFDPDYVAALGKCANSSGILEAFEKIGSANENLTQDEIRERNFGYPVFVECMERLGWDLGESAPDENGLLASEQFEPPEGGSMMTSTGDINICRKDVETYVEENFDPEA